MADRNVALLTLDFPPTTGGVQQYLVEISRRIGQQCRLTVIVPGDRTSADDGEPFDVIRIPKGSPRQFWLALKNHPPDVIVVGHTHPRLLVPAAISRCRNVTLTHGNDFEAAQSRWHHQFFNRLLARSHPLVTTSHENAERLLALGMPDPLIIPPGTDPQRFQPLVESRIGPPVLLTVGRMVPRKGIDTVLRTLPQLLKRWPDLEYLVAGDGSERSALEGLAQELQVARSVKFLGYVSDDELPAVYRRASIFVMPSRTDRAAGDVEGFGIVYLEASASGVPVIAARSGGAVDAVRDGTTGLLVPPVDVAELTQAISYLLNNPAVCSEMGNAGRRWVDDEMNWDRAAAQLLTVLETP